MKKYKKWKCYLYKKDFEVLDVDKITDSKYLYGKTSSHIFENRKFVNKMTVENSEENKSDDFLVLKELANVFQNVATTLNVNESLYIIHSSFSMADPED